MPASTTHIAKADPRNPVKVDVRFQPETGSKRPYEIWLGFRDADGKFVS